MHFRDMLVEGKMTFDYRLRPGVVDTTNALRVLRMAGVSVRDPEQPVPRAEHSGRLPPADGGGDALEVAHGVAPVTEGLVGQQKP